MHVYRFDYDWFVAESEPDALAAYREHYVVKTNALDEAECEEQLRDGCMELPDDQPLRIICDPDGQISDDGQPIERTCAEWAEREGRGFLCSTEY